MLQTKLLVVDGYLSKQEHITIVETTLAMRAQVCKCYPSPFHFLLPTSYFLPDWRCHAPREVKHKRSAISHLTAISFWCQANDLMSSLNRDLPYPYASVVGALVNFVIFLQSTKVRARHCL